MLVRLLLAAGVEITTASSGAGGLEARIVTVNHLPAAARLAGGPSGCPPRDGFSDLRCPAVTPAVRWPLGASPRPTRSAPPKPSPTAAGGATSLVVSAEPASHHFRGRVCRLYWHRAWT